MKQILIIGGGYGGLKCAIKLQKKLKNKDVKVTLVSKHDYHYQTTLLHKVAVGTYSARKARMFYRILLNKVEFIKDTIENIDINTKTVKGVRACYNYDYLVIAAGFRVNDFKIPGVKEYTHKISTINDALKIRQSIENKFKNFPYKPNENDLSFAVCGSGFTGVEFAAELAERTEALCKISGVDKSLVKVYLIGRGKHILPMFNEKLSAIARDKLNKLGVRYIKGNVVECEKDGVIIENQNGLRRKIYANTILWSAGVKGNPLISRSNIPNKNNRIEVNKFLQMPNNPEVFVIGDCAIANERDIIHAPTAQLASQMGEYCANNLIKLVNNENLDKGFHFIHRGTVCSITHTDGVGVAYGMNISGEIAAFLKNFIENRWIISIANLATVFRKGQFRFRSSD